ncbi:unnamed protein product, partial [Durusdinium trenchii]
RSSQLLQLHSSSQPMEGDEGAGCDPLRVHVTLPSGRGADLWLRPSATILDLKKAAQQSFQQGFLALFAPDGRRLDPADSLESANLGKEKHLTAYAQRVHVAATKRAFAVWCCGSSVVTWGDPQAER